MAFTPELLILILLLLISSMIIIFLLFSNIVQHFAKKKLLRQIEELKKIKENELDENDPLFEDLPKYYVSSESDFSPSFDKAVFKVSKELSAFSIRDDDIELIEQIGTGSSGSVYRSKYMGSTAAVKRCLIVDLLEDPLKDFMSETNLMSRLRHPNVVQFLGAAIKPPYFYIISEFCPKGSLDSLLKKEKLTFEIKLRMMLDTALGLLYLSRNNILHRDLKLGNLLVDANYSIKVADFGASRMIKMKETRMTKVGTIETCAPEVLKEGIYSKTSDVFSFGIVMWELFFEQPLYPNLNVYEITTKIVQEFLRPEIPKEHDVPKEIVDLMKKCWNTDPEKRPHWKEIIQILKQLVKEKYGDSMHNFPKVEL